MKFNPICLFAWALLPHGILSSIGDRSYEFQYCLNRCVAKSCDPVTEISIAPLPLPLQLTLWSCADNCKYNCMIPMYERMKHPNSSEEVVQFYGKWPFYRVLGIQEFASFIFSVLNGKMHYNGYKKLLRQLPLNDPHRNILIGYSLISVHAWFWSSIFHARDTVLTERLDYFSAYSILVYSLYISAIRIFGWNSSRRPLAFCVWSIFCLCTYAYHIFRMTEHFDYFYNMVAGIVVGAIHNLLWVWFSVTNSRKKEKYPNPVLWIPTQCSVLITLAMLLELFDFPPYFGLIDAHSLWHLATIFIIPKWYIFFCGDSLYNRDFRSKTASYMQ